VGGVSAAAPIWQKFMQMAHQSLPAQPFSPPPGVVQLEICADTGALVSPDCEHPRAEYFKEDQLPPLPGPGR